MVIKSPPSSQAQAVERDSLKGTGGYNLEDNMSGLQVTMEDAPDQDMPLPMGGVAFDSLTAKEPTIDTSTLRAHPQQAKLLQEMERKKRARQIPVPTDNSKVIAMLREYGEPITLFGEDPGSRRDRLRDIMSQRMERGERVKVTEEEEEEEEDEGEFYTPGDEALLGARKEIARYSLQKARKRLARQKIEATVPLPQIIRYRKRLSTQLQTYTPLLSELGGSRAVSSVRFSPVSHNCEDQSDSEYLLTSNHLYLYPK